MVLAKNQPAHSKAAHSDPSSLLRSLSRCLLFLSWLGLGFFSPAFAQPDAENTKLTVTSAGQAGEELLILGHFEEDIDHNQDGDTEDRVSILYEPRTGLQHLVPVNGGTVLDGSRVLVLVEERGHHGRDLNGDGDVKDRVLHSYNPKTGALKRVAPLALGLTIGVLPTESSILFSVSERAQARTDLNGDNDRNDENVLHVYDRKTGVTQNIGFDLASSPILVDETVFFSVAEPNQKMDLNGDGDMRDAVIFTFDLATGTTTNLKLAGFVDRPSGHRIPIYVSEFSQGADLNGDGDQSDTILIVRDVATNSDLDLGSSTTAIFDGNRLFYAKAELPGQDLNEDGDENDLVLQILDLETGGLINTRLATVSGVVIAGSHLAIMVDEASQAGADLNGDGDNIDQVLHSFDRDTGTITNLNLASGQVTAGGRFFAFQVFEPLQGGIDRNGDGDFIDAILHVHDTETGVTFDLGIAGDPIGIVGGELPIFEAREMDSGFTDLNGNGDLTDTVVLGWDSSAGALASFAFACQPRTTRVFEEYATAVVGESRQREDLNGDRDRNDRILYLLRPQAPPPALRAGTVNEGVGEISDVLFLNGQAGSGPEREVLFFDGERLTVDLLAPPSVPAGKLVPFVLYAWPEEPRIGTYRDLPLGIGPIALPIPLTGGSPQPAEIWNTASRYRKLGLPTQEASFAPTQLLDRHATDHPSMPFYLQGIISDPGSKAEVPASVTNGILVKRK